MPIASLSTTVSLALLLGSPGPSPEQDPADPASVEAEVPSSEEDEPEVSAEVSPTATPEPDPPAEATPLAPAPDDDEAPTEDPSAAPTIEDNDLPDLTPTVKHSAERLNDARARKRQVRDARTAGLLLGVGTTLGLAAPLVMMRPLKPLVLDSDTAGTSIAPLANAGPIAGGFVLGLSGGVMNLLGGNRLSDLEVESGSSDRRRRGLNVASGIAFGGAAALTTAAAIDFVRGGVQWNEVSNRSFSPDDFVDGEQAMDKLSRGLALLSAVPPLLGLGIGLRLGHGAQVSVAPTTAGFVMSGRF